ncbi:MAG TPA: DUF1326 domain-containing protein [Geminicoccaceae bacterium]
MAYVDWQIRGPKIGACSCDYGCPCEFNGRPTTGWCEGLEAMRIDEGWFGDTRLDGLIFAARFRWPGAVHEGRGTAQGAISAHASEAQRDALMKILGGEEQVPTTVFNIYGSTIETELEPVFADIEFACDIAARTGRFRVPDLMELEIEPIRNPVTGKPHRAQIRLPEGFEFREAEVASATFRNADREVLQADHHHVYGALTYVAYGPHGIIDAAA